jgi:hypothetical protein
MQNIHLEGVTADLFADVVFETFTTLSADEKEVELCPGGRHMQVGRVQPWFVGGTVVWLIFIMCAFLSGSSSHLPSRTVSLFVRSRSQTVTVS